MAIEVGQNLPVAPASLTEKDPETRVIFPPSQKILIVGVPGAYTRKHIPIHSLYISTSAEFWTFDIPSRALNILPPLCTVCSCLAEKPPLNYKNYI